ncbi:hypothetical protein bthur0005_53790 [Bacillus thuringiensis serovar pakistani str. T13001]|nr:hypothetical protein bthur0005_53790 [Bacillus thuringiensis serovar pakistani str. T13001]
MIKLSQKKLFVPKMKQKMLGIASQKDNKKASPHFGDAF